MYRHTKHGLNRPVEDDVRKLRALADDLERIAAGDIPTEAELANAARLNLYELVKRPVLSLYGLNEGHPRLVGDTVQTTQVWVLNEEQGWARTALLAAEAIAEWLAADTEETLNETVVICADVRTHQPRLRR